MDFLDKIIAAKRKELALLEAACPAPEMRRRAESRATPMRGFARSLRIGGVRIVAEIKRASPSKGDIRLDLEPAAAAAEYEAGGAAALSVLTEKKFFKGSDDDLTAARNAVKIPVLRKDFVISEYQVHETVALGADAILAIVRILDDTTLSAISRLAQGYGLDVLTEVFDESDLERALAAGATVIGINNRDLSSFDVDTNRAAKVSAGISGSAIAMSLSGVSSVEDIAAQCRMGLSRFLVGEALSRSRNAAELLRAMIKCGETTP